MSDMNNNIGTGPVRGEVLMWRFFFQRRGRHTSCSRDWSSDVCSSDLFKEPMKLGGKTTPVSVLTEGERAYVLHCRACHGDKGDGKGPAAPGVRPPPRDFTLGSFKFGAVPGGTLPNDDDLVRVVRFGLHGTAMRAWDGVPEQNLLAIIQDVKTFSPRWKDEEPGEPIVPTPDPWQNDAAAVDRGRAVYHG